MDIRVLDSTHPLYANQAYRLRFRFTSNYPIEAPEVMFVYIPGPSDPALPPITPSPQSLSANQYRQISTIVEPSSTPPPPPAYADARYIPLHPHVYSNGIICLDLLDKQGWSPVQNVESVCMSLQSMLAGNYRKERPEGDEMFVRTNRRAPRDVIFEFHDDGV